MQKGSAPIIILVLIIGIILGAFAWGMYLNYTLPHNTSQIYSSSLPNIQTLSKDEAIRAVSSLPEVKQYLSKVSNGRVSVDGESSDKTGWVVHVYEDFPDHRATFKWYSVGKASGEVTDITQVSSDETANWKEYRNSIYSYRLKFPTNWQVEENIGSTEGGDVILTSANQSLKIVVIDFSKGIGDLGAGGQPSNTKKTKIAGFDVTEAFYDSELTGSVNVMNFTIKKNDKLYFRFTALSKNKDFSQIDQIFSTFEFTN